MLLVMHDDANAALLWDLTTGNSLKFDFNHELAAINKARSKTVRRQGAVVNTRGAASVKVVCNHV